MSHYEVLSPWAEGDPPPPRGISPRVADLAGKTIGLFANFKVSADPMLTVVERRLGERFPGLKFSRFRFPENTEIGANDRPRLEAWVRGLDAVVSAVGD